MERKLDAKINAKIVQECSRAQALCDADCTARFGGQCGPRDSSASDPCAQCFRDCRKAEGTCSSRIAVQDAVRRDPDRSVESAAIWVQRCAALTEAKCQAKDVQGVSETLICKQAIAIAPPPAGDALPPFFAQ